MTDSMVSIRLGLVAIIVTLVLGLLVVSLPADAQQTGTMYRIGLLHFGQPAPRRERSHVAFRQGMREHGYIEGQHFLLDKRWARGHRERIPALVAEFVRLPVDVIVANNSNTALAVKQVTTTIPIVVAIGTVPVKSGLITSLAQPGGNVTGVAYPAASALSGKKLELLKEIVPQMSRVALVWNPNNRPLVFYKEALDVAAQTLGVTLQLAAIRGPDDVDMALASIVKGGADGLMVFSSTIVSTERMRIIAFADQHRLPAVWSSRRAVRDGALMAYSPNKQDMYRRVGTYVAKILQGAAPADLPMERADRIDVVINLKTAQKRGLTLPPELLYQATKVIR